MSPSWFRRQPLWERAFRQRGLYGPLHYLFDHAVRPSLERLAKASGGSELTAAAINTLSREYRVVLVVYEFTAEVNNGGLVQYLWNSSGDHAEELFEVVRELGLDELHRSLGVAALEIFGVTVPSVLRERRDSMMRYFGTHPFNDDNNWERLGGMKDAPAAEAATTKFHASESQLLQHFNEWLSSHQGAFL